MFKFYIADECQYPTVYLNKSDFKKAEADLIENSKNIEELQFNLKTILPKVEFKENEFGGLSGSIKVPGDWYHIELHKIN